MAGKVSIMKRVNEHEKNFDELYEEFQTANKIKNLRPATIEYYFQSLKPFRKYLEDSEVNYVREITKRDVEHFILLLHEKYSSPVTINSCLRAVRAILNYAMSSDYLQKFDIKLVKQEKLAKETYSYEDIAKLIKKPDIKHCPFSEYRDWVLVQYLLETGNRLSTVINIKVSDVDLSAGMMTLRTTKNRKQMFSPLGNTLTKILSEYVRAWGLTDEDYLFPNAKREQLTKNSIQATIVKYNRGRGVQKTSIHAFRHTFSKNYIMNGGNAFKLQRLLGHSSLEITQQYVSLFAQDLAEDFNRYSIIEQFSSSNKVHRAK